MNGYADEESGLEIEIEVDGNDEVSEELQAAVAAELRDAIDYIDEEVSPDRAKATRYYKGEPFGTEEDGRSDHVSTDVRDTVLAVMPSLMRIFAGSDKVVEYMPVGPEDVAGAEQATDVIHHIFYKENEGFKTLYAALKDALVRKTGIIKWWHEETSDVTEYEYTGLDEGQMQLILNEPDVELVELEGKSIEGVPPQMDPMTGELIPAPLEYELKIRRVKKTKKYCVAAVPPEEFLFDRRARDLDSSSIIGHRQILTVSDLVAMGYDEEEVVKYAGAADDELETNEERFYRNPQLTIYKADRSDDSSRKVLYIESIIRFDRDGDGVAERLKICTMGSAHKIVNVEGCDEVNYSIFEPDPEPHTLVGLSEADKVMDIQETKSEVMRGVLDSMAQSIHPRTAVVEGQVNMDDVLNNETGAVVRMRAPGMVQPLSTPFVGQAAFPLLEYLDNVKEARTGQTKASQGLNADALQSSTRAAVSATLSAAQSRIELIARIIAETGMKRLFRGLLKMVTKHQDVPMVMRLRGQFVQVDPRVWNADMNVEVNVALSASTTEERLGVLGQIAQKQEQILQTIGVNNPLVTLGQYRNTLAKIIELSGFRDSAQFFNEIPVDFQMPQQEPQQTPEQMLAQVQVQSIQADIQKKAAELELEREKMLRADDRERDRVETDRFIRLREIELKYNAQIDEAMLNAQVTRDREAMNQIAAAAQAAAQPPAPPSPQVPNV